jgi:hypothetical protein
MGNIGDFDIERRGVQQIEPASGQHPLPDPGARFPKFVLHRGVHLYELRNVMGTGKLIKSSTALSI